MRGALRLTAFTERDLTNLTDKQREYVEQNTRELPASSWEPPDSLIFRILAEDKYSKRPIGIAEFSPRSKVLKSQWTMIEPGHRRSGIATEMYNFVRELGNDISPSHLLTPEGKQLWKSFERDPNIQIGEHGQLILPKIDPIPTFAQTKAKVQREFGNKYTDREIELAHNLRYPKSQRGSIGDPVFKEFKDSLPDIWKKDAKMLYK